MRQWEPIDAPHRYWGVFDALGYSPEPIVLLRSHGEAKSWARREVKAGRLCRDWCVMEVRGLSGECWTIVQAAPEGKGTP